MTDNWGPADWSVVISGCFFVLCVMGALIWSFLDGFTEVFKDWNYDKRRRESNPDYCKVPYEPPAPSREFIITATSEDFASDQFASSAASLGKMTSGL